MSIVTDYEKEIFTFVQFVPGEQPAYQIEFLDNGTASAVFVDMEFSPGYDFLDLGTLYRAIKPAVEEKAEEEQKKS